MPDSILGQRVRCAIPKHPSDTFEIAYGRVTAAPMPETQLRVYTVRLDDGTEKTLNVRYLTQVEESAGVGPHNHLVLE